MISEGLKRTEDYRYQTWNSIIESNINADVLIMGNSRAFSNYSPRVLDSILQINSYNLGIGGYPFNVQYLRYKLYEIYNRTPKFIIQNIDFVTLKSEDFGHEREQMFPYIYNHYLRANLIEYGYSKLEIFSPLYRYFGYSMVVKTGMFEYFGIKHYDSQASYKGYKPEVEEWNDSELEKLSRIEPDMQCKTIMLFEEFLCHCNDMNIKVILVNSPVYFKATQKIINRDRLTKLFLGFSKKYNLSYLDYTNDSICMDSANFHVAVHLNIRGADLFSTKLAKDLKLILK
jgi:hypothetical protein